MSGYWDVALAGTAACLALHRSAAVERLRTLLARFAAPPAQPLPADCWSDELGVRQRLHYRRSPAAYAGRQVAVAAETALEWLALLEALAAARASFTMIELGAGFGPWLARAGVVWRRTRPSAPLRLIGVEGEPTHARWLAEHLEHNGLSAHATVLQAAVATSDGELEFECAPDPAGDWGTRPTSGVQPAGMARVAGVALRSIPAIALSTVLAQAGQVDLLHIDIQGTELEVLVAAETALAMRVGRLCVGTHSRDIEAGLMGLLPRLGFRLEAEEACAYDLTGSNPVLLRDGTQYWVNRTLPLD